MADSPDPPRKPGPGMAEHAISALNAWIGDHLAESGNALHQPMAFYRDNRPVEPEAIAVSPTGRVCVFVHGLGCNESLWNYPAASPGGGYGPQLQAQFGYEPLYVRFNTGLRISDNGRQLCALLERLGAHHGAGLTELLLIGHSMGGLVIRSACHLDERGHWTHLVRHIFYLGSPHQGAPLERATNVAGHLLGKLDTTATRVITDLLQTRSAGVKDLRFGNLVDEDWLAWDPDELLNDRRVPVPWLENARHHRIVGHAIPGVSALGDIIVPGSSATGGSHGCQPGAPDPDDVVVMPGIAHLSLARSPAVYEHIARMVVEDG